MRWVLLLSLMFWGSLASAQDATDVATPEATEAVAEPEATDEPGKTGEADNAESTDAGEPDTSSADQPESTDLTELLRPSLGTDVLESLLDDSRFIDGLIPPLDPLAERARVASSTGRSDPFQPLNIRPVQPPEVPTVPDLPTLPSLPDISDSTPPMPPRPPEPTPDPAEFAKTVQVAGVIQIGGDTFAVLSSESALSEVVGVGGRYESAFVSGISVPDGQVLLEEGGQTISVVISDSPGRLSSTTTRTPTNSAPSSTSSSSGSSQEGSGLCNVPDDIAADGSRCGSRAASER